MKRSSGLLTQQLDSSEQANAANPKLPTCYNCGKTGHIAPQGPEPKRQQANLASTGCQRGEHKGERGRDKNFRKSQGQAKGKNTQQANVSQSQHDQLYMVAAQESLTCHLPRMSQNIIVLPRLLYLCGRKILRPAFSLNHVMILPRRSILLNLII